MCDKDTCNDASCCGECEPWNCLEQQVNDILATKEDQLQGYVDEAKDAAAESKASAEASAQSAAESKEFRDEAEVAASTAVAAEGVVLGVANTLQDTADKLEQIADELGTAIAGIAVSSWFYTTVSENQTVIPVPAYKNAVDVQSIYIEGSRQSPFRGFEFDKTAMTITLAEPLPLGLEIEIILGTYNSDNPNDFAHTLASNNGASLVGTTTGKTVQEELNKLVEPDGATLYPELQIARWRDDGDVRGWGADSSATDNTAALSAAQLKHKAIRVPDKFNIGTTTPDFNMLGAGSVVSDGIIVILDELTYDPAKENVLFTPGTYLREKTGEPYPTRQNPDFDGHCYRFVLSQGSKLSDEVKRLAWITAFGNTIGCDPEEWQLIDAFGTNAMIYAGRVSRNTALGSEVMAWFGARSQADLIKNCHDYWRKPSGNPYLPGEPGWNGADLETQFPGIGARLAAFTAYVTDPELAGYCTGVGRDALNHIVAGVRNTAGGYGALQHLFFGNYNTGFGALALQSMVFGEGNSGFGDQAGRYANDCANSTFLGYAAGRSVRGAQSSVFIGDRTADNVLSATRAVIIGPEAGRNHPTNLDNKLLIANQPYGGNQPLISGDFTPNNVGINILPENIRARLHVRYASSGSTLTPQFGLLVEGSTAAGVTIETASTGFGQLRFADQDRVSSGFLDYSHSSDSLSFGVGGTSRWRIENTGAFIPMTDNTQPVGRAAFRPNVIYAGTGSINTSNETHKVREEILEAEKAAALEIKKDIWKFKFKDAIAIKGESAARYHFGVGAQSVGEILRKHGLDPEQYAFYCYDKWDAEYEPVIGKRIVTKEVPVTKVDAVTGFRFDTTETVEEEEFYDTGEKVCTLEAGENYGVRYEELLCFIMAAI